MHTLGTVKEHLRTKDKGEVSSLCQCVWMWMVCVCVFVPCTDSRTENGEEIGMSCWNVCEVPRLTHSQIPELLIWQIRCLHLMLDVGVLSVVIIRGGVNWREGLQSTWWQETRFSNGRGRCAWEGRKQGLLHAWECQEWGRWEGLAGRGFRCAIPPARN